METTIKHNGFALKVSTSQNDTYIHNSHVIKRIKDMVAFIRMIGLLDPNSTVSRRCLFSLINEWRSHNLAYSLGIYKDRSGSVDFDKCPWYMAVLYCLASFLYPRI